MTAWMIFIYALIAAMVITGYWQHRREMNELHKNAINLFFATKLDNPNEQLRFTGSEALIIDEKVEWSRTGASTYYNLTVYAVNHAGEYFIFRSHHNGTATIKHISTQTAKSILKSKFKPKT